VYALNLTMQLPRQTHSPLGNANVSRGRDQTPSASPGNGVPRQNIRIIIVAKFSFSDSRADQSAKGLSSRESTLQLHVFNDALGRSLTWLAIQILAIHLHSSAHCPCRLFGPGDGGSRR
jgi:hypothetical protein